MGASTRTHPRQSRTRPLLPLSPLRVLPMHRQHNPTQPGRKREARIQRTRVGLLLPMVWSRMTGVQERRRLSFCPSPSSFTEKVLRFPKRGWRETVSRICVKRRTFEKWGTSWQARRSCRPIRHTTRACPPWFGPPRSWGTVCPAPTGPTPRTPLSAPSPSSTPESILANGSCTGRDSPSCSAMAMLRT